MVPTTLNAGHSTSRPRYPTYLQNAINCRGSAPLSFQLPFVPAALKFLAFHRWQPAFPTVRRRFALHFYTWLQHPLSPWPLHLPGPPPPVRRNENYRLASRCWPLCTAVAVKTPQCRARRTLENGRDSVTQMHLPSNDTR